MIRSQLAPWLAALCLAPALDAAADEGPRNQVRFSVERSQEVENDRATAVVSTTHEDEDPARVADAINRDMTWALGLAKAESAVRSRSGGYVTRPISDPKRGDLRRWRGSQQLVIESGDVPALSGLLGRLQERLQLESIDFSVSPERRRAVEDELLEEALAAFRARAERVRAKLGAKSYEIGQIDLATGGVMPPPQPHRVRSLGAESLAAPALEGGVSTLQVHAQGTVVLGF